MNKRSRSRSRHNTHRTASPLIAMEYRHKNRPLGRPRRNSSNITSAQSKIKHRVQNRALKQRKTPRNKINKHSIYDDETSSSSDDEPIINLFTAKEKAPLNRIPKYSTSKQTKDHRIHISKHPNKILPQKRRIHCSIKKAHSKQPTKRRKLLHDTNNTFIDKIQEQTQHQALLLTQPTQIQRKTQSKIITNGYCPNQTQSIPSASQPKRDATKPTFTKTSSQCLNLNQIPSPIHMNVKAAAVIDLISDSEDEIISNMKEEKETNIATLTIGGIQCVAHNELEYSNAIYMWMIPPNILEYQMVQWFQKRFNLKVAHCETFELDKDHIPFKKCSRFEIESLDIKQKNHLIEMSKKGELHVQMDNESIKKVSTPPTPNIKKVLTPSSPNIKNEGTSNIKKVSTPPQPLPKEDNNINTNMNITETSLYMETPNPVLLNKFKLLSFDATIAIMISAKEMIETNCVCDSSNEIHIDDPTPPPILPTPSVGLCKDPWTFNLCVEEVQCTEMATSGDIVPMIQVIADKTGLLSHERCDEMVWFQQIGTIPKTYCEWIQNDIQEITYCEYVDLKFISSDAKRGKQQLLSFRKQLNKHRAVFINPCLFDGEYVIGIKVLGVIDLFGGGTTIKAKIVKISIPSTSSDVSDQSFSALSQSVQSSETTFTTY